MGYVFSLWLILLGALSVPNLIIAKRPDAKQLLDKIAPYQGWIGVGSVVWGIYGLIKWFGMFRLLGAGVGGMIFFVMFTLAWVCMIALGFMLGFALIKTFVKDANARAKMDETLAKISPKQGLLGIVALIDGLALLVVTIVPSVLF
jgi:hypothetical protein